MPRRLSGSAPPAGDDAPAAPPLPQLTVPAYFGPWETVQWDRVLADRPAVVVINPANGPGSDRSPAYRHLVGSLQQGGSTVLMYIATGYFERPAGAVAADVDEATAGFGVDGVFFDEVPVDDTPTVTSMIGSLAALSPGHCVFNAGRSVPASWFGRWPHASFVTFEGSAGQFDERFGPEPKDRIVGPAERQTWLVHSLPRRSHARYWRRFAEAGVGSGYLTDDRLPNPWDVYVPRGR